ncbi:MAG: acyltransferase family protein, partial [Acidimicrobiales bacterium]
MLVHAPSRGTRAATAPPEGGKPASSFRADIQGLRALAVALVVAYHAGLPIHGGFVGVDVFFVISGFVITRGVAGELERTGTVRLGRFAVRRIRRLLPALALMLTATMAFAIVASSSLGPQQAISATGHDAALFHANLGIYESVGDYFAPAAESNPLLHTWSLAVEEQFYAVFPLISLVLWRVGKPATGRRRLSIGYAAIAAVTLALSVAMVGEWYPWEVDHPQAFSYFATHYRAWEFLAGCLVALALADGRRLPGSAAKWSVLGLGAVVGSALLLDARTIFPGYAAVFPVAGTAALLAAGASPGRSHLGRALSARWVVGIGDLSYGWYLWHWPFIVFARELWPSTWWAALAAAALSLPVAAASQRLIENPIRFDGGER